MTAKPADRYILTDTAHAATGIAVLALDGVYAEREATLSAEITSLRVSLDQSLHRASLSDVRVELAAMQDQRDYYRDRAYRTEQKFRNIRKSRNELIAINTDLREQVGLLQAVLDMEDSAISEKETA